jgi:hypothetical protein
MTAKLDGTNGLLQQYDYQVLTTGFSYTFAAGTTVLVMNPAGTLATGTITMPASPADGMTITFSSTQTITALTVNANAGQSIVSAATVLPARQAGSYIYRLSNTTWYPYEAVPTNSPTLVNPTIDSAQVATVSGTAPLYMCRAWVNFNGTTAAINAQGNVATVTRTAAGTFTVAFTTALPDANYVVVGTTSSTQYLRAVQTSTSATGSVVVRTVAENATVVDTTGNVHVAIFR